MADYIELKSLSGSNHSIRKQVAYPQTPHIMGSTVTSLQAGTVAKTPPSNFYTYNSDVFVSGVKQAHIGDKWWKVQVGGLEGWIAEIHKGVKYLSAVLITDTPSGTPLPTLNIEISDSEGNYPTLNIEWKPNDSES